MSEKKCPNCGSVLQNAPGAKYCPYCQAEYPKSDSEINFELQKMQHEERVRHQKWKEEQEEKRREEAREDASDRRYGCLAVVLVILMLPFLGILAIVNLFDSIF